MRESRWSHTRDSQQLSEQAASSAPRVGGAEAAGMSRSTFNDRMDSIRGLTGKSRGGAMDLRALEATHVSHHSHSGHSQLGADDFGDDDNVTVTMSRDVGASFVVSQGSTLQIVNSPAHHTYRTTHR